MAPCVLSPDVDLAGVPLVLRSAMELAMAGARTIRVVCPLNLEEQVRAALAVPVLTSRAVIEVATTLGDGLGDAPVWLVRSDRVFHRDLPRTVARTFQQGQGGLAKIAGDTFDGIVVTTAAIAARLCASLAGGDHWGEVLRDLNAAGQVDVGAAPFLGFCTPCAVPADVRIAERKLVWSLRKSADGIMSKAFYRKLSLPITYAIRRTNIHPNQVTIAAIVLALIGGWVIAVEPGNVNGYWAGVIGLTLVNLGSLIDGVDGELARLKYLFSTSGQWLDTVGDDIGNIAYVGGITLWLADRGVTWGAWLGAIALGCFFLTQATQYWLIARVYGAGDLAAIPWAFQSSEFLSQRPKGAVAWLKAYVPKLLKRDTAIFAFHVFALFGKLEWILVVFSTGALVFFAVFFVQFARNAGAVRQARAARIAQRRATA